MDSLGKVIIGFGLILVVVGAVMLLLGRLGIPSLPGDIRVRRGNTELHFPLGLSLLVSLVLTILLNLLLRR